MNADACPIRINIARKYYCSPDWSWDTAAQVFDDFDSWNVLGGRGEFETPEGTFHLQAGDAFLLRPGVRYTGRHDPADPLIVVAIHFDWLDAAGGPFTPTDPPPLHRRVDDVRFFSDLLHRMLRAAGEGERSQPEAERWFSATLWEIARQDRIASRWCGLELEQASRIEALCLKIQEDPGAWRGVDQLARFMNCHPIHLSRLFRKYRGVSPGQFLIESRVAAAKHLLRESTHSVGRIAELLGYADIYYFSRQFTALTGQTPTAFRQGG